MTRHFLTDQQLDRAAGVLLGAACGDALGVPYEFGPRLPDSFTPQMIGGGLGPYEPGEYSDDTQMAVCIAEVAATGADLRSEEALDAIAERFLAWHRHGASDIGAQTAQVLFATASSGGLASAMYAHAAELHRRTALTAGNGSLMRTGAVGLAHLDDPEALAQAARAISDLTHHDPLAGDACVLWSAGIRHAVLHGTFAGVRAGLGHLPEDRRAAWSQWLDEAETHPPHHFFPNGYVVLAFQAAWSAITRIPIPPDAPAFGSFACRHFADALATTVRVGNDTDTVGAIAGMLLGARWGSSAIPAYWQRHVHGWPGLDARDLTRLGLLTALKGTPNPTGWPLRGCQPPADARTTAVPHPYDDGVHLGNVLHARTLPPQVDAVVSLCHMGPDDLKTLPSEDRVQIWLIDWAGRNQHPTYVIDQAARAIATLRAEGKRVLLHCAAGRSRMPSVASRYATIRAGVHPGEAFATIEQALTGCLINAELRRAVYELAGEQVPARMGNGGLGWPDPDPIAG
jgi:ADP-ribosylglycohydrolase